METTFDVNGWTERLITLVDEVADTKDPEVAIACLQRYDMLRKKMDRVQAYPQYGAKSSLVPWDVV